jgi:hypothetical protein
LKRNFDWVVMSQAEQKRIEKDTTKEYRWGIMDTNRMVAIIERSSLAGKNLKKIKKF